MGIANWPSDKLTDIVSGQVVGALNAAKMVMQLSVNIKKAVDRWAMMVRFKKDLARSKKAVSSLSSTIQGFLDNKVEQITFRTIEDALLAVQLASTIMGCVPEPFTMAIGKTMSLATQPHRRLRSSPKWPSTRQSFGKRGRLPSGRLTIPATEPWDLLHFASTRR